MYGGRVLWAQFDKHKKFEDIADQTHQAQRDAYNNALELLAKYGNSLKRSWDAILIIRCDLVFKQPFGNVEYNKWMFAFREWSRSAGDYVADTVHWIPWNTGQQIYPRPPSSQCA